jgi:hypothetical protein
MSELLLTVCAGGFIATLLARATRSAGARPVAVGPGEKGGRYQLPDEIVAAATVYDPQVGWSENCGYQKVNWRHGEWQRQRTPHRGKSLLIGESLAVNSYLCLGSGSRGPGGSVRSE